MDSSNSKIFGTHMSGFLENKKGPWKFGDRMWSLPMPLSIIEGLGSSKLIPFIFLDCANIFTYSIQELHC